MVEECEDSLSYAFCGDSTTSEAFLERKTPSKRMDVIRVGLQKYELVIRNIDVSRTVS